MQYSELQCSEAIHQAVERMGFDEMTEIQEKVIPLMMAGRDVIAKAPTGTGKTCAFGIPVAEHIQPDKAYPQAVILAPTRELAQQIAGDMEDLTHFMPAVKVACVYGGANMDKQARRLAEGCQIVVATPGRLMDHYRHRSIDLSHVTQIVLDEADEMLNMGFYKDVRQIIDLMKNRKALSMFSATISREVMDIGWLYQRDAEEVTVQPKEESQPKITQYKLETSGRNKLSDLAQLIIGEGYKRVMVFCDTKFATATLANQLARLGFSVDCLHGDLSQNPPSKTLPPALLHRCQRERPVLRLPGQFLPRPVSAHWRLQTPSVPLSPANAESPLRFGGLPAPALPWFSPLIRKTRARGPGLGMV